MILTNNELFMRPLPANGAPLAPWQASPTDVGLNVEEQGKSAYPNAIRTRALRGAGPVGLLLEVRGGSRPARPRTVWPSRARDLLRRAAEQDDELTRHPALCRSVVGESVG